MTEALTIRPLSNVGVEVSGFDASAPISVELRREIYQLYLTHGILLFRGQELSSERLIEFSRVFGELEIHPMEGIRLDGHPELIELSNKGIAVPPGNEDEIFGGIDWHSDLVYTAMPSRGAVLCARIVPPIDGDTGFIDTAAAYDALSAEMKARIENLECVFSYEQLMEKASSGYSGYSAKKEAPEFPPAVHRLVWTHPESGRKALNVSPTVAVNILGLSPENSSELLDTLVRHAVQGRFTVVHHWQVNDLVAWDNWRTMHKGMGYGRKYTRVMHRTTIKASKQLGRLAA